MIHSFPFELQCCTMCGMISALLLTFNIGLFGVAVLYFFELKMYMEQRIAAGVLLGLICLSYVSFVIGHFRGLSGGTAALTVLIINLCLLAVFRKSTLQRISEEIQDFKKRYSERRWQIFGGLVLAFILLFGYLGSRLLTYKNGSYFVQPVHAYGDISLHLGIINSFIFGNNFPPQNPNFSGTAISYPFMVDFLTAFYVKPVGLSVEQAMAFTDVVLYGILVTLMVFFILQLTKSKKAALIASALFLFNGGLGFIYFWQGFTTSGKNILDFLLTLPQDYTAIKDLGYWWINVNLSMLLPQRSFLFGFGVSILILTIFSQLKTVFHFKSYILAIVLLALLPLIHAHSLVALSIFVLYFLWFIFKDQRRDRVSLLLIGLNGLVVAYILSRMFLAQASNIFALFSWLVGWMSHEESMLRFYIKNFGVILFVMPFALYFLRKQKELFYLGLISLIWFILPSVMIFQPWDFDNIKLFIYWYFFASIVTAVFLVQLAKKGLWQKAVVGVLFGLLVLSGFLDILRVATSSGTRYSIYGSEAIKMAEFVKESTPAEAVFISADKFDNPVVSLAGRKTLMGFSPWLWTYGLNFEPRRQFIQAFLSGRSSAEEAKKYQITHAILFPNVENYVQNQQYFDSNFKLLYNQDGYRIYEI